MQQAVLDGFQVLPHVALPVETSPSMRNRVWGRHRSGIVVQLLDCSGTMVKETRKTNEAGWGTPKEQADAESRTGSKASTATAIVPRFAPPLIGGEGFSAVFETSGEALLLTDSSGVICRANAPARDLLGLRQTNPHGIDLGTVLAEQSGAQLLLLCNSRKAPHDASVDAALATGHSVRITLRSVLPGSRLLLLCLEEGTVVERAETKFRQADAELRSVLDSVPTGIVLFDLPGRVRLSNTRFGQLFGLEAGVLPELRTVSDVRKELGQRFRSPEAFKASWDAFASGNSEPRHDELEILRPARRVLERFSRPVLDREGRAIGWLELYSDVTGERQIQSKMLQTEKMAALGQLVSGIAHELNNPLTTIMGYGQLLLGHGLKPAQLSEARKVYHEAERARRIVKNLLYFARENKPERSRVDMNEIIERTLALRSYELKLENIRVHTDLDAGLPKTLADPYQLQQVVLNLLINAEQAIVEGRGQGHVWVRTRRISRRDGERIAIEIADDGPGVSPEVAYRVFDPFFTTKPPGLGTGLGLSIVYGIVHQHGGEVTLTNQRGSGAKFVVELPVVAAPAELMTQRTTRPPDSTAYVPKGSILVVEDEPTVAELIVDVLREEGHQVDAVLDSKEGLTRVSRHSYDLVICDLRMPGIDGPAFYDALVRTGSELQHRTLFITGDTLARRTVEFLEPNKLPYLVKPFLVEELKLAVHQLLVTAETKVARAGTASQGNA